MGTGTGKAAVCDHGNRQHLPGGDRVPARRCLPTHAAETSLPAEMPITARVPEPLLAGRSARRLPYGVAAWAFLPRLLLGHNGAAVRRWPDERPLDRRARAVCPCRKGGSGRWPVRAGGWRRSHSLGWRDVVDDRHRLSRMAWWRGSKDPALHHLQRVERRVAIRWSSTPCASEAWCL